MNLRHPELSIVGAPKCGTSSLHYWLGQLAGVCPAQPKETFYFMDKDSPLLNSRYNFHQDGTDQYNRFFKSRSNRKTPGKTLDSTTHYYYQQTALEQFSTAGTKVCIVLRDPTRRLLSYFQYVCLTRAAIKKPICFGEFANKLLEGSVGEFREHFVDEKEFYTLQTSLVQGHYAQYVKKWKRHVDNRNLKVILFEDLVADRQRWLKTICEFFELSVSESDIANFKKENETVGIKYPKLNRVVKTAARLLASEKLKQMGRRLYMQLQKAEKPDLESQYATDIARLYEYYEHHNQSLADLLELDLSAWTPATGK